MDQKIDKLKDELGSLSTSSYYEYKVVDMKKVPLEYLKIDSAKVQQDLKDGVRNIDGLEIYEVKKSNLRLKGGRKPREDV